MSLYCISDLHLCTKGPRDNFYARGLKRFYNFLDYVYDNRGRLFILGDLFDWWQSNLSESILAYRDLLDRLSCAGAAGLGLQSVWIPGNHDSALTKFIGAGVNLSGVSSPVMREPFEMMVGRRRIALLHGHEADPYCNSLNPGIGEITAVLSAMMEDRNGGPDNNERAVEDLFINSLETPLNLWRRLLKQPSRKDEMLDAVETYRIKKGADVAIYGHTHEQGRIGDYHYNCGTWARDRDGFVKIDDDGSVSMWTWNEDHAEPFDRELR